MAAVSVKNHPNFAVICSFLHRYGEQLRLPDLTIPELEQVLEETHSVGHGLKELLITLMRRVVNSFKADKWERHLIRLIDNYHSPIEAWELESLGFSLCKLETKLSILKYLCETQFDDNPKFKNLVNKEDPSELKLRPIGRDKLGLVYWYQKDHESNIRIYREEQDDIEETSWQSIVRGRDDLANLISELRIAQDLKQPLDSLESSRSATPVLTNGVKAELADKEGAVPPKQEASMVNGVGGDSLKTENKAEDSSGTEVKREKGLETVPEKSGSSCKKGEDGERTGSTDSVENLGNDIAEAPCKVETTIRDGPNDGTKAERTEGGSPVVAGGESHQLKDTEKCIDTNSKDKGDGSDARADSLKRSNRDQIESKSELVKRTGVEGGAQLQGGKGKHKEESGIDGAYSGTTSKNDQNDTSKQKDVVDPGTGVEGTEGKQEQKLGQKDTESKKKGGVKEEGAEESTTREGSVKGPENIADQSVGEEAVEESGKNGKELDSGEETKMEKPVDTSGGAVEVAVHEKVETEISGKAEDEQTSGKNEGTEKSVDNKDGSETAKEAGVDAQKAGSQEVPAKNETTTDGDEDVDKMDEESADTKGSEKDSTKSETMDTSVKDGDDGKSVDVKDESSKEAGVAKKSAPSKEPAWTRRRLRTRKPPQKKEEEPPAPPKPQRKPKAVSKPAKGAPKKKRSKAQDTESESSDEDMMSLASIKKQIVEEEEEEEESESEEEPTSEEEFTLRNEEPAVPVKKARTAKSKKSDSQESAEPEGDPCIKCGNYDHPEQILLCDTCDAGFHTACLRPPLMFVPDGEWFCPSCEHVTLLKNLEAALAVVDGELKLIRQKNRKKQDKFKWLLTEVCPANILPEDSSVLITKRVEKVEKPARPRPERTRPKPRQVFVEEPEEIEYIQRKSARNRKKISYKFEDFDSAINSAIHDEVEEKRKAKASGETVVYGQSRGKDMSTIEAAKWEEEEEERREARKRRKKLTDLDATTEEDESDESDDEFEINNDDPSDEDFVADDNEVTEGEAEEEEEEEISVSGSTSSDPEYGVKPRTKGTSRRRKRKKIRVRKGDLGPVRRSERNVGKETRVYDDSSSSEEDVDRPRDAWRMNPIIVPSRRRKDSDGSTQSENDWHGRRKGRTRDSDPEEDEESPAEDRKRGADNSSGEEKRRKRKRSKQKKEPSSPEYDAEEKRGRRKKRKQRKESSSSEEDEGFVQQKRKFRIDSDDSEEGEKGKNSKGKNSEDESGEDPGPKNKKQKFGRLLRGRQSRVDYRKMAEGSSSGGEDSDVENSEEEEKGKKGGEDEADSADSEAEVPEQPKEAGKKADTPKKEAEQNDEGEADHPSHEDTAASVKDENVSLSPISDIADLKDSVTPPKPEPIERVAGKKTSSEEDDLEGVTDIFDYLTKD